MLQNYKFTRQTGTNWGSGGTPVMAGSNCQLTPSKTGKVIIMACGRVNIANHTKQATMQLKYGTGTPPGVQDANTGTGINVPQPFNWPNVTNLEFMDQTFSMIAEVDGLTLGTTYWFDMAVGGAGVLFANSESDLFVIEMQ